MLNEWLVYKNFLQLSVVGQMENMNAGCVIEITASRRGRCEKLSGATAVKGGEKKSVLTLSDVLPCPLVILEERMPLDLVHTVTTEPNFPAGVRENILLKFDISEIMCKDLKGKPKIRAILMI